MQGSRVSSPDCRRGRIPRSRRPARPFRYLRQDPEVRIRSSCPHKVLSVSKTLGLLPSQQMPSSSELNQLLQLRRKSCRSHRTAQQHCGHRRRISVLAKSPWTVRGRRRTVTRGMQDSTRKLKILAQQLTGCTRRFGVRRPVLDLHPRHKTTRIGPTRTSHWSRRAV